MGDSPVIACGGRYRTVDAGQRQDSLGDFVGGRLFARSDRAIAGINAPKGNLSSRLHPRRIALESSDDGVAARLARVIATIG